jgi:hypothetical protein
VENRSHLEVDRARQEVAGALKRATALEKDLHRARAEAVSRADALAARVHKAETELAILKTKSARAATRSKRPAVSRPRVKPRSS